MMAISNFNHQPDFDGKVHKLPIFGHFNQLASQSLDKRASSKGGAFLLFGCIDRATLFSLNKLGESGFLNKKSEL
jgi:hypothetical protein